MNLRVNERLRLFNHLCSERRDKNAVQWFLYSEKIIDVNLTRNFIKMQTFSESPFINSISKTYFRYTRTFDYFNCAIHACVYIDARNGEAERRVIASSRSIGLPAILRLRQRFFVKKRAAGERYQPTHRARRREGEDRVTRTHACSSKPNRARRRVKNGGAR